MQSGSDFAKTWGLLILPLLFSFLLTPLHISAEDYKGLYGTLREEAKLQANSLVGTLEKEGLLAMSYWQTSYEQDRKYLCVVSSPKRDPAGLRELSFYEKAKDNLFKKYTYETFSWFLTLYPLGVADGTNLLTIWGGGSGLHIVIFANTNKGLKVVFEDGSYHMPEMVDIDNDGQQELLLLEGKYMINYLTKAVITLPESRNVYKWSGESYQRIKTISWKVKPFLHE